MSDQGFFQSLTQSQARREQMGMAVRYLIALILIAFSLFPVIWIISASLNPINTLGTQTLIPENAGLGNYEKLLTDNPFSEIFPFRNWIVNSLKIATVTTIFSVSITTLAAYSFSRFRFRQRENTLRAILLIQVFPGLLAMVAVFLLILSIGQVFENSGLVAGRDYPVLGVKSGDPFIGATVTARPLDSLLCSRDGRVSSGRGPGKGGDFRKRS